MKVLPGILLLICAFRGAVLQDPACIKTETYAESCSKCDQSNAICNQLEGYVSCICKTGYLGDGIKCKALASCPSEGCCPSGYSWDNLKKCCVDVDECSSSDLSLNQCVPSSACKNGKGVYLCTNNTGLCNRTSCKKDQDCFRVSQEDKCEDPCTNYKMLDGLSRLSSIKSSGVFPTDRTLVGWYRYNGSADGLRGVRMKEGCVSALTCGSAKPYSLNGSHPVLEDGIVTRALYQSTTNRCSVSGSVRIKLCSGGFYVYKYSGLTSSEVFCTDPESKPVINTTVTTSSTGSTLSSALPPNSTMPSALPPNSTMPSAFPPYSTLPSALPPNSTLPSALPPNSTMPSSPPSNSTLPSAPPSNSTLPSSPPSNSTLPSSPPSNSTMPSARPSNSTLPSSPPSNSTLPSSPPSNSTMPSARPSNSTMPSTRPSNSTMPSTRPSNPTLPMFVVTTCTTASTIITVTITKESTTTVKNETTTTTNATAVITAQNVTVQTTTTIISATTTTVMQGNSLNIFTNSSAPKTTKKDKRTSYAIGKGPEVSTQSKPITTKTETITTTDRTPESMITTIMITITTETIIVSGESPQMPKNATRIS